ncbi:MAG: VOC family protein [Nitrococcus sp.]|nr:VOC family protein [Nitrococcus sp.]
MDGIDPTFRLDHVGIQVHELGSAIRKFEELFGYRQATEPVLNTRHNVEVVFLEKPGSIDIKLFRPAGNDIRPQSSKLHHLAFRSNDLDADVARLKELGARVLNPPAPGEAFDDEPIAFLFAGGINVELISTDKRRGRI